MSTNSPSDPFKNQYIYRYASGNQHVHYGPSLIWDFLNDLIEKRHLPIKSVLDELRDPGSFFLIAATGLRKTVSVPLWLLVQDMYAPSRACFI